MNFGEKTRKRISINITSLVDILMVLLLFFMLTTQFNHMEVLNLSVSGGSVAESKATTVNTAITITLSGGGRFILRGKEYNLLQLKDIIRPLLQDGADKNILIVSTKKASVQDVVTAIDYLKTVGGKNISLAEDK